MPTDKTKPQGFEKSLERLEAVVAEMEGGDISLEEMIKRFEEGQKLIGYCAKKLDEVERKIEILVKKGDTVEEEPFEESAPAPVRPPAPESEGELF
ncbi:MAG: exodeoxyribonuclease VII small subunit [Lentisphaerae bacterium]|nr:exodeoxyribonuclease VII small subunit [Lentisphaerota bacterium]